MEGANGEEDGASSCCGKEHGKKSSPLPVPGRTSSQTINHTDPTVEEIRKKKKQIWMKQKKWRLPLDRRGWFPVERNHVPQRFKSLTILRLVNISRTPVMMSATGYSGAF
jgi:hypothetical protein